MAEVDSNTVTLVCPVCKQSKPLTEEFWKLRKLSSGNIGFVKFRCRLCDNDKKREPSKLHARAVRATEEGRKQSNEYRKEWKQRPAPCGTLTNAQVMRKRHKERNGKTYHTLQEQLEAKMRNEEERLARKQAKHEATIAWRWWLKEGAPDWWVKAYWDSHGSPWLNPRLSWTEEYRLRYRLDNGFAINERLRRQLSKNERSTWAAWAIRTALNNNVKNSRVERLLGYSIDEFRNHFERQFTKGMSWDMFKQGKVHIDHIIPVSTYKLYKQDEFKACWALSNLRPLWARDNIVKSDKVLFLL